MNMTNSKAERRRSLNARDLLDKVPSSIDFPIAYKALIQAYIRGVTTSVAEDDSRNEP